MSTTGAATAPGATGGAGRWSPRTSCMRTRSPPAVRADCGNCKNQPRTGAALALERRLGLSRVLGPAVVGDLAIAEYEVVMQVHGRGLAGRPRLPPEAH